MNHGNKADKRVSENTVPLLVKMFYNLMLDNSGWRAVSVPFAGLHKEKYQKYLLSFIPPSTVHSVATDSSIKSA